MNKVFIFVSLLIKLAVSIPVTTCPTGFQFSVAGSCFRYIEDITLDHQGAEEYCANFHHGRLAVLNSRTKMRATIEYFRTVFDEENEEPNDRPMAWVQGRWVEGTHHIQYNNGDMNHHPIWIVPAPSNDTGKSYEFPTRSFNGWKAYCIQIALWDQGSSGSQGRYGFLNMPCIDFVFTHPLCEIAM